jgi:hypothetical protein
MATPTNGEHTMIEFTEKHFDAHTLYTLVADGLPTRIDARDYRYSFDLCHATGECRCKSRSYGAESTRYYFFRTLDQAFEHATKWAKRKQGEGRKERARMEALTARMEALAA